MQNGETRDARLLTDDDVTSCITVPKTTENGRHFKARFPWPVLGSGLDTFIVRLIGNNMECKGTVTFYTPPEGEQQRDAKFTGRYIECEYIQEFSYPSGSVECNYRCSCGGDVCSAVYIFVIDNSGGENQEFCELSFA